MNVIRKASNAVQKVLSTIRRTFVIVRESFKVGVQKIFSFIQNTFAVIRVTLDNWYTKTFSTVLKVLVITGKSLLNIIAWIFEVAVVLASVAGIIYITTATLSESNERILSSTNTFEGTIVSIVTKVIEYFSTNRIVAILIVLSPIVFAFLCAARAHEKGRRWWVWFFVGLIFNFLGYLIIYILATEIKVYMREAIVAIRKTLSSIRGVIQSIVVAIWEAFWAAAVVLVTMTGIAFLAMKGIETGIAFLAMKVFEKGIERGLSESNEALTSPLFTILMLTLLSPIIFALLCASVAHAKGRRWWIWLFVGLIFNFVGYAALSVFRERQPSPRTPG